MTSQLPDVILINGEKMNLFSNPLEQYWTNLEKKRPHFLPLGSCKRGYVALWEIKNRQLFLRDVDGTVDRRSFLFGRKPVRYSMKMLFSKSDRRGKADWYSGKLRVPRGNMIMYQQNGYDSRFEKEIIITVDKGNVTKMVMLDYTQKTLQLI